MFDGPNAANDAIAISPALDQTPRPIRRTDSLDRSEISTEGIVHLVTRLEHLELGPALDDSVDAPIVSNNLQSPAVRIVSDRTDVERRRGALWVLAELLERREEQLSDLWRESQKLSLSRATEIDLLAPRAERTSDHDSLAPSFAP